MTSSRTFWGSRRRTLVLLLAAVAAPTSEVGRAADGFLVEVTASSAPIKTHEATLATVERGARLWGFKASEDNEWVSVKVPGKEQMGWLFTGHFRKPEPTESEQARLDAAYQRYDEGERLYEEGNKAEAVPELRACLEVEEQLLGGDHPQVADSLNYIGYILWELQQYEEAQPLLDRAHAIRRRMLGERHVDTLDSRINVALVADSLGDYAAARAMNEETLALCREVHGEKEPATLTVLNNLGWVLYNLEEYEKSATTFDEAYQLRRQALGENDRDTLASLVGWAEALWGQNNFVAAKEKYQQAYEALLAEFGENDVDTLSALYGLAWTMDDLGQQAAARELIERAIVLYREALGDTDPGTLNAINLLGVILSNQGDHAAAVASHREALELRRRALGEKHADTLLSMVNVADELSMLGDNAASRQMFEETLNLCRDALGERDALTLRALNGLGWVLMSLGDYAEGATKIDEAYRLRREEFGEGHLDTLESLNSKAYVLYVQGDFAAAKQLYQQAFEMYRQKLGADHATTLVTLYNQADMLLELGDFRAARKLHQGALDVRRKVLGENHPDTVASMESLANVLMSLGDYAVARDMHERVLRFRIQTLGNEHRDTIYSMRQVSISRACLGDYESARQLMEQGYSLSRDALGEDDLMTVDTMNILAWIIHLMGDYPAARAMQEHAFARVRQELGERHPWTLSVMSDLALSLGALKEFDAARQLLEEQLRISREVLGEKHFTTLYSMQGLGHVLTALEDYPAARRTMENVTGLYRSALGENHPDTLECMQDLAVTLVNMGDATAAAEMYQQARSASRRFQSQLLPALSEREQLTFLGSADNDRLGECLTFALTNRNDHRVAALSAGWLVNGKAVAQEALAETALLSQEQTAPLVRQLRSVRSRLAKLTGSVPTPQQQQQIAALETEQQQLVRQIGAAGTGMSRQDPWVSLAALRGELRPGSVMINIARLRIRHFPELVDKEAMWKPAHYVAWVVPAMDEGTVQIFDLGVADELDALVAEAQEVLNKSVSQTRLFGEAAAEKACRLALETLARAVLKPLEPAIDNADQFVLSPDGALWLVPWGALPIDDGKFLIEKYQIDYVTSGRELVSRRAARTAIGPPVVMANPSFDLEPTAAPSPPPEQLARRSVEQIRRATPLPGTESEAAAIRPSLAAYAGSEPIVHLRAAASETQFKQLYRPRTLVLSTHGFFLADQQLEQLATAPAAGSAAPALTSDGKPLENPLLRCGLLLAGCNQREDAEGTDDGVLTGLEIVGTDLRGTELVVLSACQTGVGEVRNGEGVAGLRQAFQLAGAESIVATLWQIPDTETARLMNDFFKNLAAGQSKGEALRNAQLARINARRDRFGAAHPFFWAAFTLTGK